MLPKKNFLKKILQEKGQGMIGQSAKEIMNKQETINLNINEMSINKATSPSVSYKICKG